jgi:hypothetical protein
MAPVEERTIREELAAFRREFGVFATKLMGDDEGENAQGRIPRLEAAQASQGRRLARLEGLVLMVAGALGLFKVIGWLLEASAHLVAAAKIFK